MISPIIIVIALNAPRIGQGLTSTRWNGWFLWLLISLLLWSKVFLELRIRRTELLLLPILELIGAVVL